MKDDDLKQAAARVREYLQNAPESLQNDAWAVLCELFRARGVLDQLVQIESVYADYFSMPPRRFWEKHRGESIPFEPLGVFHKMRELVEKYHDENDYVYIAFPAADGLDGSMRRVVEFASANPPAEISAGLLFASRLPFASIGKLPAATLLGMPVVIDETMPPNQIRFRYQEGNQDFNFTFSLEEK